MVCHNCQIEAKRFGKDRKGNQRFRCLSCRKTFQEPREKPLNNMYLPMDKAELCLRLLVEGNSIRSTERITGVNRNTILDLLVLVGEKCERLLNEKLKGLSVRDVQADEMWGDRKSTRLNSSHANNSYAVFCLKKKKETLTHWIAKTPGRQRARCSNMRQGGL